MPRPTLFPYTTLFRSPAYSNAGRMEDVFTCKRLSKLGWSYMNSRPSPGLVPPRSEEWVSRNAETDPLSLHDALPISGLFERGQDGGRLYLQTTVEARMVVHELQTVTGVGAAQIGRVGQQECRDRPSFPTRRSSDLRPIRTRAGWRTSLPANDCRSSDGRT